MFSDEIALPLTLITASDHLPGGCSLPHLSPGLSVHSTDCRLCCTPRWDSLLAHYGDCTALKSVCDWNCTMPSDVTIYIAFDWDQSIQFSTLIQFDYNPITTRLLCKVVKRLSVNRLPVKLLIAGFDFQLPITDLPTFFFTSCNFRLQLRLHWTQTYRRRPTARSHWFIC